MLLVMCVATIVILFVMFISWMVFVEYGVERPLLQLMAFALFVWIAFITVSLTFID